MKTRRKKKGRIRRGEGRRGWGGGRRVRERIRKKGKWTEVLFLIFLIIVSVKHHDYKQVFSWVTVKNKNDIHQNLLEEGIEPIWVYYVNSFN